MIRAAHALRPLFPDGVFFVDLFGMSAAPLAAERALGLLLRALGVAEQRMPSDLDDRASLYRSLPAERRVLVVLDAAGLAARLTSEERRLAQLKAGDLQIASAFRMSYEQLTEASRRVFRRLFLVPGRDFDVALAAVVGGLALEEAWDALNDLVDRDRRRPLVRARPPAAPAGRAGQRGGGRAVAARERRQLGRRDAPGL